jgi:Integrase core domain
VAESFFATLKKELVHRRSWPSRRELTTEAFECIEAFYNRVRRHSTLGMLSPADYENGTLSNPGAMADPAGRTSASEPPATEARPRGGAELEAMIETRGA